jgi:hypothetical protein
MVIQHRLRWFGHVQRRSPEAPVRSGVLRRADNVKCHTRFSKEQNQANHMCAQEVHTYVRMKKYQNNIYIKRETYYINTYNYQSVTGRSLIFSSGSNITGTTDWG